MPSKRTNDPRDDDTPRARSRPRQVYFPGWVCRFYVDDSVPPAILSQLKAEGSEIVDMGSRITGGIAGMFWRFLVADDATVRASSSRAAPDEWSVALAAGMVCGAGRRSGLWRWPDEWSVTLAGRMVCDAGRRNGL